MGKRFDINSVIGKTINNWIILSYSHIKYQEATDYLGNVYNQNKYYYNARCIKCGEVSLLSLNNIRVKHNNCFLCSKGARIHGRSQTKIYSLWKSIIDRCYNENNQFYLRYGGRGITVCKFL